MSTLNVDTIYDRTGSGPPQVKGRTDGTFHASGFVGERIAASFGTTTTVAGVADTEVDIDNAVLSLTSGNYLVNWRGLFEFETTQAGVNVNYLRVRVTDNSNTLITGSSFFYEAIHVTTGAIRICLGDTFIASLATNTTFKLRMTSSAGTATGYNIEFYANAELGIFTGVDNEAIFEAIRI